MTPAGARQRRYADLVGGLLDARIDPATARFDAELATALAAGTLSRGGRDRLRFWQRASSRRWPSTRRAADRPRCARPPARVARGRAADVTGGRSSGPRHCPQVHRHELATSGRASPRRCRAARRDLDPAAVDRHPGLDRAAREVLVDRHPATPTAPAEEGPPMSALRLLPELEDALRHIQGVKAASVVTGPGRRADRGARARRARARPPSRSCVTSSRWRWRGTTSTSTTGSSRSCRWATTSPSPGEAAGQRRSTEPDRRGEPSPGRRSRPIMVRSGKGETEAIGHPRRRRPALRGAQPGPRGPDPPGPAGRRSRPWTPSPSCWVSPARSSPRRSWPPAPARSR